MGCQKIHLPEISTLAPREGSDQQSTASRRAVGISTLAPREGSDRIKTTCSKRPNISTLAPREGSDPKVTCAGIGILYFYPRSP